MMLLAAYARIEHFTRQHTQPALLYLCLVSSKNSEKFMDFLEENDSATDKASPA